MPSACPHCGSNQTRDARFKRGDGLKRRLLFTPRRCQECRHRYWVFNPFKPVLLAAAVAGLSGLAAWGVHERPLSFQSASSPHSLISDRAARGDAEAQLAMGHRYAQGDGVVKNEKEAAKWYEMAAKKGLSEAQYQYGLALLEGRGVVQDYQAAFRLIEKPALKGHANAQYSLGELYRYGTGTAIDKARAYLWFNLAAAQGLDAAAKARDSLVWQLKPEQVTAMQEEARRMSRGALQPEPTAVAQEAPAPNPN
jgi:TPR repeat protein